MDEQIPTLFEPEFELLVRKFNGRNFTDEEFMRLGWLEAIDVATRREAALVDALSRIDLRVNSQYDHDGCCNTCQDSLNRIGDEAEQALAGHKGDKSDEAKGDL